MLTITIPSQEFYDEVKQEFVNTESTTMVLEHSLASLSKWESKWEVPFMGDKKTDAQVVDYVRCMTLTPDIDPEVYQHLSEENSTQISAYIDAKMTATWFADTPPKPGKKEVITSELIYYWMVSLTIPFECQDWHLNRLLTLIKVCNSKNQPEGKKMSRSELAQRNRRLNEERKAKLNTAG